MELLKCLGAPSLTAYLISAGLFVLAYILYRVLLTSFRHLFRHDGVWKQLVEAFRFPALVILLEIAAFLALGILGIKEHYEAFFQHVIVIVSIATIGWLLINTTRSLYRYFYQKYEAAGEADEHQRAMITQVHFLFRLIIFLIFAVTFAAILMTFPRIKSVGIGILSSAGIAGIALGVAARPILLNLMAGFQIAMTKTIKIGDAVFLENDFARVEAIHLTHVIVRTWDLRRLVFPISYFIDKPFQNWDAKDPELLATVFLHCDYSAPVEAIRQKIEELVKSHPSWNQKVWKMHVTNCTEQTMELRIIMTANDAATAFELKSFVREKIIDFLQKEHPTALPCVRYKTVTQEVL
ncbi:MAG: hypothetical protein S4CHLAM2_06430 [Chlamydiales bacterium]|nr:hypothetical protein [Chlamydiales bacterium]